MSLNFSKNHSTIKKSIFLIIAFTLNCSKGPDDIYIEMWKKICEEKSIHPMIEYTAPESVPLVSMFVGLTQDEKKGPKLRNGIEEGCKKDDIYKVSDVVIKDDIGTFKNFEGKEIKMRKIDGKWKMVLDKPKK